MVSSERDFLALHWHSLKLVFRLFLRRIGKRGDIVRRRDGITVRIFIVFVLVIAVDLNDLDFMIVHIRCQLRVVVNSRHLLVGLGFKLFFFFRIFRVFGVFVLRVIFVVLFFLLVYRSEMTWAIVGDGICRFSAVSETIFFFDSDSIRLSRRFA